MTIEMVRASNSAGGRVVRGMVAGLMIVAGAGQASAAKLGHEICGALRAKSAEMIAAGVKKDLELDAAWARSNLPAERVQRVLAFIDITEKVLFQCPPPLPPGPPLPERIARQGGAGQGAVPATKARLGVPPLPSRRPARSGGIDQELRQMAGGSVSPLHIGGGRRWPAGY